MSQFLIELFGAQNHITILQEADRAVLIFAYGLLLLRLSGPRMFGRLSALDITIMIMVGSALARAMTGNAPLLGTMIAASVMTALHVALAHGVARSGTVARLIEGEAVTLIRNGHVDHKMRKRNKISEADMREALRQEGVNGEAHVDNVKLMTLEPSGKLSVIKIDPCRTNPA